MEKKIVAAAIKYNDKIYTGFDHGQAMKPLIELTLIPKNITEGFITNTGEFVDRKKAMIIAKQAKQLTYETNKKTLISEDLHLNWFENYRNRIVELESMRLTPITVQKSYTAEELKRILDVPPYILVGLDTSEPKIEPLEKFKVELAIAELTILRDQFRQKLLMFPIPLCHQIKETLIGVIDKRIERLRSKYEEKTLDN